MTTRPQLRLGAHLLPGVVAIGTALVLLLVVLRSEFGEATGYPAGESVIENIGFALLNIDAGAIPAEGFLVALIAIAVVLDAALGGAVMLGMQDEEHGGENK